jgi:hypothetical protein
MPAPAAEEPSATSPTSDGMLLRLGTSIPTMNSRAKISTARKTFITGPAR